MRIISLIVITSAALALNPLIAAQGAEIRPLASLCQWLLKTAKPPEHPKQPQSLPANLRSIDAIAPEIERRLGVKTSLKFEHLPGSEARREGERVVLTAQSGGELATFSYFQEDENRSLLVGSIHVAARLRGIGISEYLFAAILERYPEIRRVDTILLEKNQEIARKALTQGASCIEAIKLTPAYRMRQRFGFSAITEAECEGMMGFVVERSGEAES